MESPERISKRDGTRWHRRTGPALGRCAGNPPGGRSKEDFGTTGDPVHEVGEWKCSPRHGGVDVRSAVVPFEEKGRRGSTDCGWRSDEETCGADAIEQTGDQGEGRGAF